MVIMTQMFKMKVLMTLMMMMMMTMISMCPHLIRPLSLMTPCFRRVNHLSNTQQCTPAPSQPNLNTPPHYNMSCMHACLCFYPFFCVLLWSKVSSIDVLVVLTTCKIHPPPLLGKMVSMVGSSVLSHTAILGCTNTTTNTNENTIPLYFHTHIVVCWLCIVS